ncbi:MAG TPA: ureidoglycolate lyase [Rhodopila sp.]|nr:ureidoglycolate lyase [Rhodopila sp.]
MPEIRDLPVMDLSPAAFAPYGTVIPPMEDGTAFGPQDGVLRFGTGIPRFYTMRVPNRGMVISHITRHRQVTQVLASSGGQSWLLAVAPPPAEDVPEARPAPQDIRAFRIPGDTAVMLLRGAWHAGPLFEAPEASFFNLGLSDTNVTDHWSCDLKQQFGLSLRLVTVG